MRIIPVLDLLNGITVQAVAGHRDQYRPVRSQLTGSVDPSVVLKHLDEVCDSGTAYIADLDAILRRQINRCTLAELSRMDISLMVDAGIQSPADVEDLLDLGINEVVIGLESLPGPEVARELIATFPTESLILSLDMKSGTLLADYQPWSEQAPMAVLEQLSEIGFRRWILLDLSSVGTGQGVSTVSLCRQLRSIRPDDEIITGGGIRSAADLTPLSEAGLDGVLVASALHNGAIGPSDLRVG